MHILVWAKTSHDLSLLLVSLNRITQDEAPFKTLLPLDNRQPYPQEVPTRSYFLITEIRNTCISTDLRA